MVLQRFYPFAVMFLFLVPLCVGFNLTLLLHLFCGVETVLLRIVATWYYFVLYAPKTPQPHFYHCFLCYHVGSFFADCVICAGSVADCTVSVYSLASGGVLDCFLI